MDGIDGGSIFPRHIWFTSETRAMTARHPLRSASPCVQILGQQTAKSMQFLRLRFSSSFFCCLGSCTGKKSGRLFQSPPTNNNLQLIKSVKHQPTGLVATQIKSLKPLLSNGVRHKTQELLRRGLSEFQPVCVRQPVLHRILCKCSFNQI